MTAVQEQLANLPEDKKELIAQIFDSVDILYETVYLIAKNEHLTEMDKSARYEDRLQVIRRVRAMTESLLSSYGLEGKSVVADIASDYFEDYVKYKERDVTISNDKFLDILHKITGQHQ